MEPILQIENLHKRYGRITAVGGLSVRVNAGDVFGILGPNGSGKTTTLSVITGVVAPDEGHYRWFGRTPEPALRQRIGSLIEVPNFYPYLDLLHNLILVARIKRKPPEDIERVLKLTSLWERRKSRYDTLSLGMKQRLALSAVLLGDPQVLVLDEPANGLDPEGIAEVREIILQEAGTGKTIILASHILGEVEKVCSHVAVLKQGNCIALGRVHELLAADDPLIVVCSEAGRLKEALVRAGMSQSVQQEGNRLTIVMRKGQGARELNEFAFQQGIVLEHLETRKKSLESQFLELVK